MIYEILKIHKLCFSQSHPMVPDMKKRQGKDQKILNNDIEKISGCIYNIIIQSWAVEIFTVCKAALHESVYAKSAT